MNTKKSIAKAERTFAKPTWGKGALIRITAEAYQLKGNQHPHFSVTAAIGTPSQLKSGNWQAGGCLHEESAKAWPKIKPIIALHLSNADDGEPMYAEANGFYWLAGTCGGLGERYHGASGSSAKSQVECLQILAEHLRITPSEAQALAHDIADLYEKTLREGKEAYFADPAPLQLVDPQRNATNRAKCRFNEFVNAQRQRWQAEANAGLELLRSLNTRTELEAAKD